MSLKKLDVSKTSNSSRRLPTFQASEPADMAIPVISRWPVGLDQVVSETQKICMYTIMCPSPTRDDWVKFYLAIDELTASQARTDPRAYFNVYPEQQITAALGDDRETTLKEIVHYIMHYRAITQLVVAKAVTVMNLSRVSGVLYSGDAAATLRFSTFNTILRFLQGTPMSSVVYDSILKNSANFINLEPDSGLTLTMPYWMSSEDAWVDLPTIKNSVVHPIGGITRRPPTFTEYHESSEYANSGIIVGANPPTVLSHEHLFEPKALFNVGGLLGTSVRNNDTFLDHAILELAAAVEVLRTRFGVNPNHRLCLIGPSQYKDTIRFWNQLGVIDGEFDVSRFMNDVNAIELFDYQALADAKDRNMPMMSGPIPARVPASALVAEGEDYDRPSHSLLRPFEFVPDAEQYPGQYRIAFDLDIETYLMRTSGQWCDEDGIATDLPAETPYCALAATTVAEVETMLQDGDFPDAPNWFNFSDPIADPDQQTGFFSNIIQAYLMRYAPQTQLYMKPEERELVSSLINGADYYIPREFANHGVMCPLPKRPYLFNPADVYQKGEFVILNLKNGTDEIRTGSWEAALLYLNLVESFDSDVLVIRESYINARHLTADNGSGETASLDVTPDDEAWLITTPKLANYIGLTWGFVGDALRLAPFVHFRRKDIGWHSSATDFLLAGNAGICLHPFRPHSDYEFNSDISVAAAAGALAGVTFGVDTLLVTSVAQDPTDANFGGLSGQGDFHRSLYPWAGFIPGYLAQISTPVLASTLYGMRKLISNVERMNPEMGAIKQFPTGWFNPVKPELDITLQKGIIMIRRDNDLKASHSRSGERSSQGRNPGRKPFYKKPRAGAKPAFAKDSSSPVDLVDKSPADIPDKP